MDDLLGYQNDSQNQERNRFNDENYYSENNEKSDEDNEVDENGESCWDDDDDADKESDWIYNLIQNIINSIDLILPWWIWNMKIYNIIIANI